MPCGASHPFNLTLARPLKKMVVNESMAFYKAKVEENQS